jgi:hypothetical protein
LCRPLGSFERIGDFRPRTFAFDAAQVFPAILTKFAARRMHHDMEDFSRRWIDRAFRLKQDPRGFARSAFARLAKGRREI